MNSSNHFLLKNTGLMLIFLIGSCLLMAVPAKAQITNAADEKVILILDELPKFPGCEGQDLSEEKLNACAIQKMSEFIGANLMYPEQAKQDKLEGTVIASFIVQASGELKDVTIIRGLSDECDAEVLRVVGEMPNWIPGKKDGKAVPAEMKLPVKFKM